MPIGVGTNFEAKTGNVNVFLTNNDGNAILVSATTANIPSGAAGYAVACILRDGTTGLLYSNTGTTASCTFTKTSLVATGNTGYFSVAKTLSGATPVNVFGSTNGFAGTVTDVKITTSGTTSASVTLATTGTTIATVTTSATAGAVVGAQSYGTATFTSTGTMTLVSSKAGDTSTVLVAFTVT